MDAFYTENIVTEKYGYNMTINLYQDIDAPNPFDRHTRDARNLYQCDRV